MATTPYRVTAAGFWRAYAITLRPYLFFVSGAAGLVGLAMTDLPPLAFGAAFLAFFLSYGLGQALTDVFQRDTDALSSPYRPLVRGEIAPGRGAGGEPGRPRRLRARVLGPRPPDPRPRRGRGRSASRPTRR